MDTILEIDKPGPVTPRWVGVLLFFFFLGVSANLSVSWGQEESVLEHGPYPDSVQGLNSPLDIAFVPRAPVPWTFTTLKDKIRDSLRSQLEALPAFFRDTELGLNFRTYYLDRENRVVPPRSDNEALTIGGSLAYQSGWLADTFRMGLGLYTSQKLYGPRDRDGTLLLRPGQQSYTVLGLAYGEFKYENYNATLFRQYIDTPYVNRQDNRMTPNTFEAYRITGRYDWVQFTGGYVAEIKSRNASDFRSMSEQAGAPPGRERGMVMAGARFTPTTDLSFGAINYYVPSTLNIFYTEANYTWALSQKLGLRLQGQFTEQDSVGGDNLIGAFNTRVGGAQVSMSYDKFILRTGFSVTADSANIQSPYGTYPGYIGLLTNNFNRAGETGWLLGLSYDFKDFIPGFNLAFNFGRGTDARNSSTGQGLPNASETDVTVDYRVQGGPLRGLWFRLRNAYNSFNKGAGKINEFRFVVNYPLPIL